MPNPVPPWFNVPPTAPQNTREWPWAIQFWHAAWEREACKGHREWPRHSFVWNSGYPNLVTSVSQVSENEHLLTCSEANWVGDGGVPYHNATGGETEDWMPFAYDAIIECGGPGLPGAIDSRRQIHLSILARESSTTIRVTGLHDCIASKRIDAAGDLVGKELYILKSGGLWHLERWPAWAQSPEHTKGTATAGTTTTLTDAGKNWLVDQWAGKELIVRDGGGLQRRLPILSNTPNTLTVAAQSFTLGGQYAVIPAGGVYLLGKEVHQPWRWYSGARSKWWAHGWKLNGEYGWLLQTMLPAASVEWAEFDPAILACRMYQHPATGTAVDLDLWSDVQPDPVCSEPDKSYAPHLWKTWRSIQAYLEQTCGDWIEKKDYTAAPAIPWLTPATFFKAAGINAFSRTVAVNESEDVVNVAPIELGLFPLSVHYAILTYDGSGNIVHSGTATMPNSETIEIAGLTAEEVDGKEIIVSPGWTRFAPRHFQRLWDKAFFVADLNPDPMDTPGPVDPPRVVNWDEYQETGTGKWIFRPRSTTYNVESGGEAFVPGELARFTAEGWNDPVDGPGASGETIDPQLPYYDRAYQGKHPIEIQRATVTNVLRSIAKAGGSTRRFVAQDRDWTTNSWNDGGIGHIESGTATSGSTTSLTDASKVLGTEAGAFCHPDRFVGFPGPYVTFVVEIQIDGVWHKRLVTAGTTTAGGLALDWTEALSESASGKPWRIIERLYELNRWQGRGVLVKRIADGALMRSTIIGNDGDTLFVDPPFAHAIEAGDVAVIEDHQPGTVWQFAVSPPEDGRPYVRIAANKYWVAPRGVEAERTGVAAGTLLHPNMTENQPTLVKRYGRMERYDAIGYAGFYHDLAKGFDALRWTKASTSWSSKGEINHLGGVVSQPSWPGTRPGGTYDEWDDVDPYAIADYADGPGDSQDGFAPIAYGYRQGNAFEDNPTATLELQRTASYGRVTGVPTLLSCATDFYAHAVKITTPDPENEFNSMGDPVEENKWTKYSSGASEQIAEKYSADRLGDLDTPPVPARLYPGVNEAQVQWEGYQVNNACCIHRWDVAGGLQKLLT